MNQDGETGAFVYERTQQSILELIERRSYCAGDKIPSERDLAERFGVDRITVRRAIANLLNDGILERRGTSGTYIPGPEILRPISSTALPRPISRIVEKCGGRPGGKLIFFEHGRASLRTSERLATEAAGPLFVVKRLRTADDLPFCVGTSQPGA